MLALNQVGGSPFNTKALTFPFELYYTVIDIPWEKICWQMNCHMPLQTRVFMPSLTLGSLLSEPENFTTCQLFWFWERWPVQKAFSIVRGSFGWIPSPPPLLNHPQHHTDTHTYIQTHVQQQDKTASKVKMAAAPLCHNKFVYVIKAEFLFFQTKLLSPIEIYAFDQNKTWLSNIADLH